MEVLAATHTPVSYAELNAREMLSLAGSMSPDTYASSSSASITVQPMSRVTHEFPTLNERDPTVVFLDGRRYLIGVQLSQMLNRETFNLYRSMKVKGIEVIRADADQVDFLMKVNSVKRGTRSVTFVAFESGAEFVEGELVRQIARSDAHKRDLVKYSSYSDDIYGSSSSDGGGSPASKRRRVRKELKAWEILLLLKAQPLDDDAAGSDYCPPADEKFLSATSAY